MSEEGKCCGQLWAWHMFCGQDLWWTMSLHIFHWSCWDTIWIPTDHMDLCQTHCRQVPDFSCAWGHVVSLDQSQASLHKSFVPVGRHPFVFLGEGSCWADEELKKLHINNLRHHRTVKVCPKGTLIYGEISYLKFGYAKAHILAPSSSYLRVYMGCALAVVFQVRSLYVP